MTDFLPEGYEIPVDAKYMKFEEGENRFRVLASAIIGTEYWTLTDDKKHPVRVRPNVSVPIDKVAVNEKTGNLDIKHFWAFPVWNYKAKRVQILELTQKTIMKAIKDLVANPKWGDPKSYDILVTRGKENGKTAYTVMPDPKDPITEEIKQAFMDTYINLNALFDGTDPFEKNNEDINPEEVTV